MSSEVFKLHKYMKMKVIESSLKKYWQNFHFISDNFISEMKWLFHNWVLTHLTFKNILISLIIKYSNIVSCNNFNKIKKCSKLHQHAKKKDMERNGWWIKEWMDATFALFHFVMYPNISLKICCNLQSPKSNLIKKVPFTKLYAIFIWISKSLNTFPQ